MRIALLSAAAFAAATLPGTASAAAGYIDLSYGATDVEGSTSNTEVISFGGAAAFDLSPGLEAQGDAHWSRADDDVTPITLEQGAFHIFHRTEAYSYGFAGRIEDTGEIAGQVYDLGLVGQYFSTRATIDASVSFASFDTLSEDATRYQAGFTVFPTDNFSAGVNAQRVQMSGGDEIDTYVAEFEFRPGEGRASYFANYRASDDGVFTGDDTDGISVGVRLNFGTESLIERRHSGPGFRTGGSIVGGAF